MERKLGHGAGPTSKSHAPPTRRSDKKGASTAADDCGQLDAIIGGYGKYQLMIFMFKILIGATSAFNNLGVTFFAPSDFISFWCADAPTNTSTSTSTMSPMTTMTASFVTRDPTYNTAPDNQTLAYDLTSPHAESYVRNLSSATAGASILHSHHYVQPAAPTRTLITHNIRQLLGDFVTGEERVSRKQQAAYSSDTPRNLRKECDYLSAVDNQRHKCAAYQYDTGIWISTIVDEWDLVCDRTLYISLTQSLYMAGFIASYLMFGYLSDRFGRWKSLVLGALIEILSGFGCAFAGSVHAFMLFRFLLGLGCAGRSSSSYLMMIEWTGQSWRMHISTLGSLGWVIGYCAMPWLVLFFLHFRHMQLFVCFYEIIFLIWLLRLPESPRWLLTHRRFGEAYRVLLGAAKFNGLILDAPSEGAKLAGEHALGQVEARRADRDELAAAAVSMGEKKSMGLSNKIMIASPISHDHRSSAPDETRARANGAEYDQQVDEERDDHYDDDDDDDHDYDDEHKSLQPYTMEQFELKFGRLSATIGQKDFSKNEDRLSFVDLFRWPNLRRYTLILAFAWAVNSFIYYGIALHVGDFGAKNLFVSFTFAGATELPSIAFTMLCMKFLPRRTTNIFLFSTILTLCALQVPLKYYDLAWAQQLTMMLAKLFNSCSFTCILYQTVELFPTSIRQTAYSSASLAGRIGSILAPFIKQLSQRTNNLVPPVIYAILSFGEILLIRHLPETQGSDLPDTLLEAESFRGTDCKQRPRSSGGESKSSAATDRSRKSSA